MKIKFKHCTELKKRLLPIVILLFISAISLPAQSQVLEVEAIGFTVSDMEKSIRFFSGILSFEEVADVEVYGSEYEHLQGVFGLRMRVVRMKLGDELIELTEYLAPQSRPIPVDSRSNDLWFQHIAIVVNDMDQAYEHLRRHKVRHASTGPQTIPEWNEAAAGIRAFYFKDPDGHNLEIIYFPAGKGDPKWQKDSTSLFLGIDHTAIVVNDTQQSLKFYQDLLGLKVAGESVNYGIEQEHLNNVFGARLHITALRAAKGPGIEFLEYLAPSDGRPMPVDIRANDIMHWQINLVVRSAQTAEERLRQGKVSFVSTSATEIPESSLGFEAGVLIRDPDGHGIRLITK